MEKETNLVSSDCRQSIQKGMKVLKNKDFCAFLWYNRGIKESVVNIYDDAKHG